jgi:heme/copper-type cytochrome/quinol oxidase subunit 1
LALLGLIGDTARGGSPKVRAALLFAVGSVLLLVLGTVAGALLSIDPLDLHGTTWEWGQMHLVVLGAGALGGLGGLWWWAPKLFGVELPEGAGVLVFLATFAGSLLLAVPELISGLVNDLAIGQVDGLDDTDKLLAGLSAAGAVLLTLGGLLAAVTLLASARRKGRVVADNPWDAGTLEWATTSPPPAANFSAPLPAVLSATPLLADEVNA